MARIERITEIPMLILAFVYVVAFVVSYIRAVPLEIRQDARFVEDLVIVAFAAELILKVAVADRRFEYLRHRWLDMIIVVVPFLRPLRLLVVLPMVARALVGLNRLMSSYQGAYALLAGLLTVFTGAGLILGRVCKPPPRYAAHYEQRRLDRQAMGPFGTTLATSQTEDRKA